MTFPTNIKAGKLQNLAVFDDSMIAAVDRWDGGGGELDPS